jgi:hypothetical protein
MGAHTWDSLQDYSYSAKQSPPPMAFDAYLSFLARHDLNFFRLWAWESPSNRGALQSTTEFRPMAYERTGPGKAADGKPKFDLRRFNPEYFQRMRERVGKAGRRGVYVSIMLFNGFSIEGKGNDGGNPWLAHPMNPANNVNGVDGAGVAAHTLANPAVTALQEAYVRKVVATVNSFDNVLYEIANEDTGSPANIAWQYHMIRFVKGLEARMPKQHPVGMTSQWPNGSDAALLASPADWISPGATLLESDGTKVVINDTDHSFFWIGLRKAGQAAQVAWAWGTFARGGQCLFMDPYLDPSHDDGRNAPNGLTPDPYWDPLRDAMGAARACGQRMDLAAMRPADASASTGFCLANPGKEYLVFEPGSAKSLTIDLADAPGSFSAEWRPAARGTWLAAPKVEGGAVRTLAAPFPGASVLHLWR